MFYLQVIEGGVAIQTREYYSASECCEKLLIAWKYYQEKKHPVILKMFDNRKFLIKAFDSEEEIPGSGEELGPGYA